MLRLGLMLQSKFLLSNCTCKRPLLQQSKAQVLFQFQRNTSFFNKLTAEQLWEGVVSVSNAGKKRGRGKGHDKKGKKNLNFGQKLGFGKESVLWPGLTAPIIQSNTLLNIQKLPPDNNQPESPTQLNKRSRLAVHPLERGWSGRNICGKNIGPPDPEDNVTYDDFESYVVSNRVLISMTSLFGKKRKFTAIVLTGNGKGLIGLGKSQALVSKLAISQAKNKAVKKLVSFNFDNDYSVNHDFFCQFGKTEIFVYKKPAGYGLKCHRVLAICCKLIGIKNIAAKVERGRRNVLHVLKAFLIGLMQQKMPQEIADDKKLHLVEFKKEKYFYPNILASPKVCLTPQDALETNTDYENYIWKGKTVEKRFQDPLSRFHNHPGWKFHLKKIASKINNHQTKINLMAEYNSLSSHLTPFYPECQSKWKKKNEKDET